MQGINVFLLAISELCCLKTLGGHRLDGSATVMCTRVIDSWSLRHSFQGLDLAAPPI